MKNEERKIDLFINKLLETDFKLGPCTDFDKAEIHDLMEGFRTEDLRQEVRLRGMLYTG